MSEISETIASQVLTEAFPILNDVGIIHKGEYSPTTQYIKNNVVTYLGSSYICTTPTIGVLPTNISNWQLLASKGDRGVVFQWKGVYSNSVVYDINDAVVDSNKKTIYSSLVVNNTNNLLTDVTKWEVLMTVDDIVATANSSINNINITNTNVQTAETARVAAENSRVTSENTRSTQETSRQSAETGRSNSETTRQNQESTRQSQETTRQTQESSRQTSTTTAINNLNNAVNAVIHKGVYNLATAYVANNSVSYNGSSWRCLQNTTGNAPIEGTYWTLEAAAGSVASVTSANTDISVANPTSSPTLTLNSGTSPNQIPKRDTNGNISNIGYQITNISTNTTLTYAQSGIINVTTAATPITITLPTATTTQVMYTIKKADSGIGTVTIATTSSQTIDGVSTKTLTNQYANITIVSDGANWNVDVDNYYDQVLANPTTTPLNLGYGLQVATLPKVATYNVLNITGRTLVNLLGRDGNCETLTTNWQLSNGTSALDSTNKTTGNNGIKLTVTTTGSAILYYNPKVMSASKYYICLADVKNGNTITGLKIGFNGGSQTGYITDSTKFTTLITKINPADGLSNFEFYVVGTAGQYGYVDAIRIYEVTSAEYTTITIGTATDAQISKYPYVDDVKHVNAPYVIKYGENLLPTFNELNTLNAVATVTAPYTLQTVATAAGAVSEQMVTVLPNTQYTFQCTFSATAGSAQVAVRKSDLSVTYVDPTVAVSGTAYTFTTDATTTQLSIRYTNTAAGTITHSNPMLNVGATAKPFKPRNDDYLLLPNTQLASSVDGTVYDQAFRRDGKWWVLHRFSQVDL